MPINILINELKVLYRQNHPVAQGIKEDYKDQYSKEIEEEISNFLFILNILGFDFDLIINDKYKPKVKLLIKKWHHLKESKNYIEADKVREKLRKLNILWY